MKRMMNVIKKDIVFLLAAFCAAISAFWVPPSRVWLGYLDLRVLTLLFALMILIAAFESQGIFQRLIEMLLRRIHSLRGLATAMVLTCFFSSMLITNDVALITFVPFALTLFTRVGAQKKIIYVIVLQTIAVNLGSMLTPVGNPQNLFLYTRGHMSLASFTLTMLPYSLLSLVLLLLALLPLPGAALTVPDTKRFSYKKLHWGKTGLTALLFALSLTCVLNLLDYRILLVLVVVGILILDRRLLAQADYMLLLTFVAFFIFVGNVKQIPQVDSLIRELLTGHETVFAIVSSQFISNVPSAVLLSGFTDRYTSILVGCSLGGLGTLVASMASLISYRIYGVSDHADKKRFMAVFTAMNLIFLLILFLFYLLISI